VSLCHYGGSLYIAGVQPQWSRMATLDLILLAVFGFFTAVGLATSGFCFRRSLKVASERDGDVKMFFWAVGGLVGLILAGMSSAYILLPILLH